MPFSLRFVSALAALVFIAAPVFSQQGTDHDGNAVKLLSPDKVVVMVFLRRDCPVSSRYAPVIQQISKTYSDRAKFLLVFPDKSDSAADIQEYLSDYHYSLPAFPDPGHTLAKMGRVQITPEVAVFSDRRLVYDGRIDDWYIELGRARAAPTTHELKDALDAALAGKVPARAEVRGVGCYISDLE
jgi:thiol-disulfide isomerase/thioredoxin